DTLTATMINRNGQTRDLFSIIKRGKIEPARLALPWQPPEYKKPDPAPKIVAMAPIDYKTLIARNAAWQYLAGQHPHGQGWTQLDFNAAAWKTGMAGFGFGEVELRTELADLSGKASSLYIRKEFNIEQADKITELGLLLNYRDAFIAYINGREVARV